MKRIIALSIFLLIVFNFKITCATETDEIIEEQEKTYGISSFIKTAEEYTEDTFEDIKVSDLYKEALTGRINTNGIAKGILKILGKEVTKMLTSLGLILIIIIVHSIIRSISEGLGNESIGEITYYLQYILIVTLIMANFSEAIVMLKDTINDLVGFINSLLPILLALMVATRKYSYSFNYPATSFINNNFYRKLYNYIFTATYTYWNCSWNSI